MKASLCTVVIFLIFEVTSVPTVKRSNGEAGIQLLDNNSKKCSTGKGTCEKNDEESSEEDETQYCYIGDGVYIKEGEQAPAPKGECMAMQCVSATPLAMRVSAIDCNWFVPRPGCLRSDYDNSKQYPLCCPGEIC